MCVCVRARTCDVCACYIQKVQDFAFEALRGNAEEGITSLQNHVRTHPNDTEALNFLAAALVNTALPDKFVSARRFTVLLMLLRAK